MGFLNSIGGVATGLLQTPEGQELMKKFLSSPDGQRMMIKYISTREGEQFLGNLLLGGVDAMNITPEQKDIVRQVARLQVQGQPDAPESQPAGQEQTTNPAPDVQ
jgi:hypothetical protein